MKTQQSGKKTVANWLLLGCLMIAAMVMIGGITRLTHSGLSITAWEPISGAIPPLNEAEWQEEFDRYRQYPEFKVINSDMDLSGFKSIFFWEYLHRNWGRLMGLVFIIPFVFFLRKKYLTGALRKRTWFILLGGAAVGALGWFMVMSGLNQRPDVSHYRLAMHLTAAFTLFLYILWTYLSLIRNTWSQRGRWNRWGVLLLLVTYVQVIYGAFVAGLDAATIYNTYPLMNGEFMPDNVTAFDSFLQNFTNHRDGVQFVHRNLALVVVALCGLVWWKAGKLDDARLKYATRWLLAAVVLQFVLGVVTLLLSLGDVPVFWGVIHQMGALFFLAVVLWVNHRLYYPGQIRDAIPAP